MKSQVPEGERRRAATVATHDKFIGKPIDWSKGRHCVRMAQFQMRGMGMKTPTLPRLRSALAARKALKERGWDSVSAMFDSMMPRIPPAMMRLGDIAVTPGDEGFEAVLISLGDRAFLGWLPDGSEAAAMVDCNLGDVTGAWRVGGSVV